MTIDSISDLLTRVRNANGVYQDEIALPSSNMLWEVAQILKNEGFIKSCELDTSDKHKGKIKIALKYGTGKRRVISGLKRISKPGRRVYAGVDDLKKYRHTFGITILSTPKGILTNGDAYKQRVGGEVLCIVW